jgi:hypothetical protein
MDEFCPSRWRENLEALAEGLLHTGQSTTSRLTMTVRRVR